MGYICAKNNCDSLAFIFYERASEDFNKSGNEWRYAQSVLDICESNASFGNYYYADSLWKIARTYYLDSAYQARLYETRGLYFYEQQQYDSALVYFRRGLDYWQSEEEKSFSYMKVMQIYLYINDIKKALPYSQLVIKNSNNLNYISNAYYCLMQDAKEKDDAQQLSIYSHARTDAQKLLRDGMVKDAEALPILENYLQNPHPWRRLRIIFAIVVILFILFGIGLWYYRKRSNSAHEQLDALSAHVRTQEKDLLRRQSLLEFEKNRLNVLEKYHTPHKRWRNYLLLKRDIDPWMHDWLQSLDSLSLSELEKIFCVISIIYPHMTDVEIADFICYGKDGIRVFKNRIFKKLGVKSLYFADSLRNLSVYR
jgi:tetratricopeptide (TPR) repeat protein